jgi:large subunit ribosomal protein L25
MEFIQIAVQQRAERGTTMSRRLRQGGLVPAVLYGLDRPNLAISVPGVELTRFLRTGSRLVELKLEDKTRAAILREVQQDPVTDEILHVDFVRVDKDKEVDDRVPVVIKGRAKGVGQGGVFQALLADVHLRCRPLDLPKEIVVDVSELALNEAIHVKDLKLPAEVKLLTNGEMLVAHVIPPKLEVAAEVAPGEAAAEPELIRKAPAPGEEGEEAPAAGKGEKAEKAEKPAKAEKPKK